MYDKAEIEVKRVMLDALKKKLEEVEPLVMYLRIEKEDIERDIKKYEEKD
jgi:hypothetical protein